MRANNLLVVVLTLFVILPLVVEGGVFIRSTGRILTAHQSNKERLQNKLLEIRGGATGGKMSKTGKVCVLFAQCIGTVFIGQLSAILRV